MLRPPRDQPPPARAPGPAAPQRPLSPRDARGPLGTGRPRAPRRLSSSGTLTGAPAGARPVRAEGTSVAPGAVTKAPVHVRVEPAASQPSRPPVGTLGAKVAPVSALPAAQIVAVKAPAAAIQLPASLQLPPATCNKSRDYKNHNFKAGSSNESSNSQNLCNAVCGGAIQCCHSHSGKPSNTVTTLKPSSLGASHALSSEPTLNTGNSAAAQTSLTPAMLENVKKCKNFLAMLIKLACSGSQSPEMGQNVKKLVGQLLKSKRRNLLEKLYVELKSSPQPHLVPFLKLLPSSQSFIQQCVQQTPGAAGAAAGSTPVTAVTATDSSVPAGKALGVSGAATPRTVSVQSLNSFAGPGGAKAGVVTLHPVGPAAAAGGAAAGPGVLQTPKPLVTSVPNTVTAASLPPERPVVPGAGMTLALPAVTLGETSSALCLPSVSVKTVVTCAGTTCEKPVVGAPVQITLAQPGPILSQSAALPQAVTVKQLVVPQPAGGLSQQVGTLLPSPALTLQKKMPVTTAVASAPILKQTTLPGNKILPLQVSSILKDKIKENGATSLRDEDDINDVTFMAGVNLNEENACILATNSELVGTLIQSCKEEPFLFVGALQKRILDIGKKHDVTELSSEAVNLISHATQERLRGLLEKLTTIARHRMTAYKTSENYILSSDTRSQLKFLEKLDQLEKQRKDLEEREMLLRAAKSRANKEDPEQLRLKQKAKELQQLELAQIQQRDANLTALAAIGPRRKRPLEAGPGSEVGRNARCSLFPSAQPAEGSSSCR
ncbi:hypothetical protein QTO34_002466 [Cnephaeus nilssonii]|uniref:TAFH domain-containing protein n=1 Tax=Cnephaeus nilssonii TaxID=3371016 RepID=A0AA40LLV5_CNENI|nr:hypothetical protein QTO34_002466 [Eptesicus nilssonii]